MTAGTIGTTTTRAGAVAWSGEKAVSAAFVLTGLGALMIGALLGPFQALNYGGVNLYDDLLPFLRSYYQGLTLHGVLNALVFTTFFHAGVLLYFPARELNVRMNLPFVWSSYAVMLAGLLMAGTAIVANTSTVLYTFYPPLSGHWAFYTGLALVVVGSLMGAVEVLRLRTAWRRANPGKVTPLVTYMSSVTMLMWMLATVGLVVEVVVFLIPWSAGWISGVDPQLARTRPPWVKISQRPGSPARLSRRSSRCSRARCSGTPGTRSSTSGCCPPTSRGTRSSPSRRAASSCPTP